MKYLIQNDCPDFIAPALMPDGSINNSFRLSEFLMGHYGVIFFYPLDFNYISWTELLSVQKRIQEFTALNARLVAVSADSYLAHRMWKSISREDDGLERIDFPMIADMTKDVSKLFDVVVADAMPEAATIIVDQDNKIVFQLRHDTSVGRNIDRILEAIHIFDGSAGAPTAPVEQLLLVEENAQRLHDLGYHIVAQSVDTSLDHPQWKRLPRDTNGIIQLSFPLLDHEHEWPHHDGLTIAIREGLHFHSTGLLMPDGQLLFEHHADRQIPRDFSELLRIADAVKKHFATGDVIPWEVPSP